MALMSFTSLYGPSTGTYTQAYRDKYFQTCLYAVVIWTAFPTWGVVACSDAAWRRCVHQTLVPSGHGETSGLLESCANKFIFHVYLNAPKENQP